MLSSYLCCRYTEGEQQDAVEYLQEKLSDFALPNVPGQQSRNLFEGTWRNQVSHLQVHDTAMHSSLAGAHLTAGSSFAYRLSV